MEVQFSGVYDNFAQFTPEIAPGDTLSQTFSIDFPKLNTVSIAFCYDTPAAEDGTVFIQLLANGELFVEQALPLTACPNQGYLMLSADSSYCDEKIRELTIRVTNTSSNPAATFSLFSTAFPPVESSSQNSSYEEYTINDIPQGGVIFCSFEYMGYQREADSYRKATRVLWTVLGFLLVTGAITLLNERMPLRRSH